MQERHWNHSYRASEKWRGKSKEKSRRWIGKKCGKEVKEKHGGGNIYREIPMIFNDKKLQIHKM